MLGAALIAHAAGHAEPILSNGPASLPVSGWSNASGNFAVDFSVFTAGSAGGYFMGGSQNNQAEDVAYSTASSNYSLHSLATAEMVTWNGATKVYQSGMADLRIDAVVQGNGSVSGNLQSGSLLIQAGVGGFPGGVAPGTILAVGEVIDAAALQVDFDTEFLIKLTYLDPLLADLGDYVTFFNPEKNTWGVDGNTPQGFQPWGTDVDRHGWNFESWELLPTTKVPEPATLALVMFSLGSAFIARRRRAPGADDRRDPR